ncbi:MAG: F0F1 ATP synthase subunit A [Candidatus Berkelbacteria bacterium]|nr:F0F1 ATP synthase subunit A [Candidatus Berkelbacteria bacterium]
MIEISLKAEQLGHLGPLPVNNSLLASWCAVLILIVLALIIRFSIKLIPSKIQSIFEMIIEYFLGLMEEIYGSKEKARKVFPWVATFFIFILSCNWIGILPGIGSIGLYEHGEDKTIFLPFLRSANADLNTTLALAIISVLLTQIFGILAAGFFKYSKRFFNFSGFINFFAGILEFFSELIKVVSFSFRLFGNIFAGEVLLVVISALVPFVAPLPFYFLEIFVGFIQALVFTMLTIVFIRLAFLVAEEGH